MTTTKTTARSEIYDIAKAAGFDVEVAEGVERKSYDRRTGWGNEKVEYFTRFLLRRSPEAAARLAAAGARYETDEFTVLFKDVSDAFADAWQRSQYSYVNAQKPWTSNNHSQARITKAKLIEKLEKSNVERLVEIYEQRAAADRQVAKEKLDKAITARRHATISAENRLGEAAEALHRILHSKFGVQALEEECASIVETLLTSGHITDVVNARTVLARAQAEEQAAIADAFRKGVE